MQFSAAGHSDGNHVLVPLEVRKKLPKVPATTRVGNQDMGYSSDGQNFSVVGGAFRQVK